MVKVRDVNLWWQSWTFKMCHDRGLSSDVMTLDDEEVLDFLRSAEVVVWELHRPHDCFS